MNEKQIGQIIYKEEDIQKRIDQLAKKIDQDYIKKEPILIGIFKGSIYFLSDLSRKLNIEHNIDFLSIGRFRSTDGLSEKIKITKDLDISIRNREVIVIEDIIRTGLTHSYILKNLKPRRPNSINLCVFLNCEEQRLVDLPIKYSGFELDNRFVIGYGLDYEEKYRNLPYIAEFTE
ncbi:MAG: hypoxanthine phosphoribosyltransferase [Halanaerobiales bacterium]|nr:hypoxanthine phosphoribosyltransferase [Halanaerobiales bacterium]